MKIYYSERFLDHKTENHPECPERLVAARRNLASLGAEWVEPRKAAEKDLSLVHSAAMIEKIKGSSERGAGWLDPDTYFNKHSWEAAVLAAGAAMGAAENAAGFKESSFALVRPPGHHAGSGKSGGFCLFNNVAVAAKHLQVLGMVEKVAVFDFDLHHGNGTQEIFWDDPSVLYVSIHQSPAYPGTGTKEETGGRKAPNSNLNFPFVTANDSVVEGIWEKSIRPAILKFEPGAILVSAGFDGHYKDPLGSFEYTEALYAFLGRELQTLAKKMNAGLAGTLEGGYNLDALGSSIHAFLQPWSIL